MKHLMNFLCLIIISGCSINSREIPVVSIYNNAPQVYKVENFLLVDRTSFCSDQPCIKLDLDANNMNTDESLIKAFIVAYNDAYKMNYNYIINAKIIKTGEGKYYISGHFTKA